MGQQGMRPAVTKSFSPFGADQAYFLKDFVKLLREKKIKTLCFAFISREIQILPAFHGMCPHLPPTFPHKSGQRSSASCYRDERSLFLQKELKLHVLQSKAL